MKGPCTEDALKQPDKGLRNRVKCRGCGNKEVKLVTSRAKVGNAELLTCIINALSLTCSCAY